VESSKTRMLATNLKSPGGQDKRVISERDKRALVRIANTNRGALLAVITNELNLQLGTTLTNRTTRKYLHDLAFKWTNEWQMVVFSDESRFCLHKSDSHARTWRRVNEKDCINSTVTTPVMFWGCFSWWGVGLLVEVKVNMNSDSYVDVLVKHFIPWANSLLEKYPNEIELIF
ncbi:20375_t:CDS:2, partial [Gigaspora margarita]